MGLVCTNMELCKWIKKVYIKNFLINAVNG